VTPDVFLRGVCATIEEAWRADGASLPSALLRWATDAARLSPFLRLPLLTCEATGGDPAYAIPVAAAWHLLHCAAALLDDVEDQALEVPLDPARVVNWATALTFAAQLLLRRPARWGLPAALALALSEAFNSASLRVCAAQDADLAAGPEGDLSLDDYWRIAGAKGASPWPWPAAPGPCWVRGPKPRLTSTPLSAIIWECWCNWATICTPCGRHAAGAT